MVPLTPILRTFPWSSTPVRPLRYLLIPTGPVPISVPIFCVSQRSCKPATCQSCSCKYSIGVDGILVPMKRQLNKMRWLRAILRWLGGSRLVEPVPRKLFHVTVPVPRSELVPRNIGGTEPFLETELRAAVPLYRRKPHPGPLAQAEAFLS